MGYWIKEERQKKKGGRGSTRECIGWATGLRKSGRKRREEEARHVNVLGTPPNWAEHNLTLCTDYQLIPCRMQITHAKIDVESSDHEAKMKVAVGLKPRDCVVSLEDKCRKS